jgi:hypothetical protein
MNNADELTGRSWMIGSGQSNSSGVAQIGEWQCSMLNDECSIIQH